MTKLTGEFDNAYALEHPATIEIKLRPETTIKTLFEIDSLFASEQGSIFEELLKTRDDVHGEVYLVYGSARLKGDEGEDCYQGYYDLIAVLAEFPDILSVKPLEDISLPTFPTYNRDGDGKLVPTLDA